MQAETLKSITIIDNLGKVMMDATYPDIPLDPGAIVQLDVSGLFDGTYVVYIKMGGNTVVHKLVKP